MYDIRCNKRNVYLRMYCHNMFRGDGFSTSDICKSEVGINETTE
jgi:hypothetical protein